MTTTNLIASSFNNISPTTPTIGCANWNDATALRLDFGSSATDLGFGVGFRSTAKYPFNRGGTTTSHPDDVWNNYVGFDAWVLGPGRGVANMDQFTNHRVLTGAFNTNEVLYNGGIGESFMYALSPGQKCDKSPCYNLSTGFCQFNNNSNTNLTSESRQIEKIFKPDETSKTYALNGIETYQVKPGVNKQWWRFLPTTDTTLGSTSGTNNLCQTSRVIYKYANIFNPRDIVYQDVFEKYTNYTSLDIDKTYENNFNLVNRFVYSEPNIFITSMNLLYGTLGGLGPPTNTFGSRITINNLNSTFRDRAASNVDNNKIFDILLKNNCLDWKVRYVDQNGNIISGTITENIKLESKNRAVKTYSDYYVGSDTSPTTSYFNVNNTTRNIQIGEIYFIIDITDITRTFNDPKITTYFSYFNNTSGNRNLDKTIRNGVDNTPPLNSSPYSPPKPPTIFIDKSKFYPDIRVLWNNEDTKPVIKNSWTAFTNYAHDLTVNFDIKNIAPNGGFVVVGKVPNSTQKCFMVFTPNCLNNSSCTNSLDCSWNTMAPVCNTSINKCIQCNSTEDCKTGELCKSQFCSNCIENSDCPAGQLCMNGLCKTCFDYSDCQSLQKGSVCNNGTCQPCSSTLPCPNGMLCVGGVCTNCTDTKDCPTGQLCNNGFCVNCSESTPCAAGLVCSNGLCNNCSSLYPCPTDKVCDNGSCVNCSDSVACPTGKICNNGSCVNCSSLYPCPTGKICNNGSCVNCSSLYPCPTGKVCDNGSCVNCSDSVACPTGKICKDGSCVNCSYSVDCPTGKICDNGSCVNCSASVACPTGKICNNGSCVNCSDSVACPTGKVCKDGMCVNQEQEVKKSNTGIIVAGGGIGLILMVLLILFLRRKISKV